MLTLNNLNTNWFSVFNDWAYPGKCAAGKENLYVSVVCVGVSKTK